MATARASDDTWKHPDPRFAAIEAAVDEDDYVAAQRLLADLRSGAKRAGDDAPPGESSA